MHSVVNDSVFADDEYENKLLLHKPKFQRSVLRLRQKWKIPEEGFVNNKAHQRWQLNLLKNDSEAYKRDVISLMRIMRLSDRWYQGVSSYIQTNAPTTLKAQPNIPVRIDYDEDGEHRDIHSIWLQVDRDTTQREIVEAFKAAQDMFGANKDKKQKPDPKNLDRDLAVFEQHQQGMKTKDIATWLNENYKGTFNTEDVKTIVKRIKRKLS